MLILAKEEDSKYDEKLIQRRFLHTTSTNIRNYNIRNDLCHVLQNVSISDELLIQLVSEAVVNNSERTEKLAQHKKNLKVNKTEADENPENPLPAELRKIQFEHSNQLGAFRSEILEIKQAVSQGYASGSEQTFPGRIFQRCPNCTVTKSKSTHCFVCGSDDHRKDSKN